MSTQGEEMREAKAIILWLFIIFIILPLIVSICIYSKESGFWISLGLGFLKYYVVLTVAIVIVRIIYKVGDKNE